MMLPRPLRHHLARALPVPALFLTLCLTSSGQTSFSSNPTRFVVCDKGVGSFRGKLPDFSSRSGVIVSVAAKKGKIKGFAIRSCEAKLTWGRHDEILIAPQAAQVDIDVMGADLGLGTPVVAFQIRTTAADPGVRYEIYSLNKPPKLLRTITGQDFFSAADTRLDGSVEIWTTDSAAVNGFENLPLRAFDSPPPVVLRFEDEKLMDVSSEFQSYFDDQIRALRSDLGERQLSNFRNSDGKLSAEHLQGNDEPRGLLATKIKVLEIVWCYLSSGREQKAWDALADMWPPSDVDRIRAAISKAATQGMRTQVDGVSHLTAPASSRRSNIYDTTSSFGGYGKDTWERTKLADTGPEQILLRLPSPNDPQHWDQQRQVELVIDEAGKVRSVRMQGGIVKDVSAAWKDEPNQDWIDTAPGWKYIPAFKDGHPIAFRSKLDLRRDQ
ncbi:MAG TPA: hypothetical protein VGM02_07995 [Acidobacteriaceae bacterium]|jgi:hypothetical protein